MPHDNDRGPPNDVSTPQPDFTNFVKWVNKESAKARDKAWEEEVAATEARVRAAEARENTPSPTYPSPVEPPPLATAPAAALAGTDWVPGLVGEIAKYIYGSAYLPVREVAEAGALALVAGIAARQFNTYTSSGLNLYLVVVGKTGVGKEAAKDGIDRIVARVREPTPGKPGIPTVDDFRGTDHVSGPALVQALGTPNHECFYSILGEFGITLKQMNDPRAPSHLVTLKQALLDLYSRSGRGKRFAGRSYSDKTKNVPDVVSPCVTLLCDTTPGIFYEALDKANVENGLIPRLVVFEYTGERPQRNECPGMDPHPGLVQQVARLTASVLQMRANGTFHNVLPDDEAKRLLEEFETKVNAKINGNSDEFLRDVWNRAHLNALKIATLVAIGCNHLTPTVTAEHARWAIDHVERGINSIARRFESGEAGGSDQSKAAIVVRRAAQEYLGMPPERREKYRVPKAMLKDPVIPYAYFLRRLVHGDVKPFKDNDGLLKTTLKEMVDAEILCEVPPHTAAQKWNTRKGVVYALGESW